MKTKNTLIWLFLAGLSLSILVFSGCMNVKTPKIPQIPEIKGNTLDLANAKAIDLTNAGVDKGAITVTVEPGAVVINNYFIFNTTMSISMPIKDNKMQFWGHEETTNMDSIWGHLGYNK